MVRTLASGLGLKSRILPSWNNIVKRYSRSKRVHRYYDKSNGKLIDESVIELLKKKTGTDIKTKRRIRKQGSHRRDVRHQLRLCRIDHVFSKEFVKRITSQAAHEAGSFGSTISLNRAARDVVMLHLQGFLDTVLKRCYDVNCIISSQCCEKEIDAQRQTVLKAKAAFEGGAMSEQEFREIERKFCRFVAKQTRQTLSSASLFDYMAHQVQTEYMNAGRNTTTCLPVHHLDIKKKNFGKRNPVSVAEDHDDDKCIAGKDDDDGKKSRPDTK